MHSPLEARAMDTDVQLVREAPLDVEIIAKNTPSPLDSLKTVHFLAGKFFLDDHSNAAILRDAQLIMPTSSHCIRVPPPLYSE